MAQQTTSKKIIYYTPLGNTPIDKKLIKAAVQAGVKVVQIGVK